MPYSLVERTVERDLLPMARALGLAVTTWAPLGGGLLTGRYGTGQARPEDTRLAGLGGRHEENATSARNLRIADAVKEVASGRGASATQVALAWLLAQRRRRGGIIPILGVRTEAQLRDNLGTLDLELAEEELVRLEEASQISPGFPLDFGGARLAHGETFELIDEHRVPVGTGHHTGARPDVLDQQVFTVRIHALLDEPYPTTVAVLQRLGVPHHSMHLFIPATIGNYGLRTGHSQRIGRPW